MKRLLIAVLAVLALAVGATVASAHRGQGHGDKGGASERLFTLTARSRRQSRGRRVRQALEVVLRRHHRRRRHLPRHARQRHRRAVHPRRHRQVGRRPEGQARQALRRGRRDRLDHRLRHRHQGAGREVRDRQRRLPQRPPGHRNGDVYVTDSFRPTLWHVTATQVAAGSGTPQGLDSARSRSRAGEFNVNGIVAKSARKLVVVDTNSGKLFRIKLGDDGDVDRLDRRDHGRDGARRRRHAAGQRPPRGRPGQTRPSCRS